ncbi:MAG: hypothetical protein NZ789_15650, partial [Pseudomonadales bacterium]|nr:hypothetical protein [Pseudomonadales bacterium]
WVDLNRDRPETTWLGVDTRVTPALGENEQAATLFSLVGIGCRGAAFLCRLAHRSGCRTVNRSRGQSWSR